MYYFVHPPTRTSTWTAPISSAATLEDPVPAPRPIPSPEVDEDPLQRAKAALKSAVTDSVLVMSLNPMFESNFSAKRQTLVYVQWIRRALQGKRHPERLEFSACQVDFMAQVYDRLGLHEYQPFRSNFSPAQKAQMIRLIFVELDDVCEVEFMERAQRVLQCMVDAIVVFVETLPSPVADRRPPRGQSQAPHHHLPSSSKPQPRAPGHKEPGAFAPQAAPQP
eukprot:TRINITY_DN5482_c0_g1_i1.p3 TRINITY_DN5482_c0_g1~~TRINITY_DN5482_c0_g1_i1.p3  ORF type:complete len:249 (-),score=17.72 TRINITY_DN5482_c0_g1_i1:678-1343(-)